MIVVATITGAVQAQDSDQDSYAAKAYWRMPFYAKPHFGVMVERDFEARSRPPTQIHDPLWRRDRIFDLHLSPVTLEPLRLNGLNLHPAPVPAAASEENWQAITR